MLVAALSGGPAGVSNSVLPQQLLGAIAMEPGTSAQQPSASTQPSGGPATDAAALAIVKHKLRCAAAQVMPAIFKRDTGEAAFLHNMGIRVPDWESMKRGKGSNARGHYRARASRHAELAAPVSRPPSLPAPMLNLNPAPKLARGVKSKSNGAGRQYTSKFRGVHQTFPTKRWEAQFRRNGKPTSLGCFDHEEEAARAYDKMMLWCELHNAAGVKGGITNYDPTEYDKEIPYLQSVTQDDLIESLRSDGRRQAAHRMLRQKREGPSVSGLSKRARTSRDGSEVPSQNGSFGQTAADGDPRTSSINGGDSMMGSQVDDADHDNDQGDDSRQVDLNPEQGSRADEEYGME